MVGHPLEFYPSVACLHEQIAGGELGRRVLRFWRRAGDL